MGRSIDNAGNIGIDQGLDSLFFDNVRPITTANFDGEFYNEDSWSWESTLSGTGYDSLSGIDSVKISVERLSDNQFFDGTSWNAFENWFLANGTDQWTFPVQDLVLEDGVSYERKRLLMILQVMKRVRQLVLHLVLTLLHLLGKCF